MNWYASNQLKDILTAWYGFTDNEEEQKLDFLTQRYKNVNKFLGRTEMNEVVRETLIELRRRIVAEIRKLQAKMRDELV